MGKPKGRDMPRKQSRNGGMWNPRHVGPFDTVLRTGRYADVAKLGRPVAEQIEIGDRFGSVVVTGWVPRREGRGKRMDVLVKCDCGSAEEIKRRSDFRNTAFTGCTACARYTLRASQHQNSGRNLGLAVSVRNKLARQLSDAVSRCTNPAVKSWPHYGGRGISVFWLWRGKSGTRNFIEYVSTLPNFDNPTFELDRKDNDGNYEPGNIRFISRGDNMLNRRKIQDFETVRTGLRFAGLWPTEPLHDTYAVGALSFGA